MSEDRWFQRRIVHPRAVWAGTAAALIGMVATGAIMISSRMNLAWIGVVVVVVGAGYAWWNGAIADTHSSHPAHQEIDDIRAGFPHDGVLPTDRLPVNPADARGLQAGEYGKSASENTRKIPPMTWADRSQVAAAAVALASAWLLVTAITFQQDPANHDPMLRQMGFSIMLVLLAVRLLAVAPTPGAAEATVAISTLQIVSVWWWPHSAWVAVAGLSGGAIACVAGIVIAVSNRLASRTVVASKELR